MAKERHFEASQWLKQLDDASQLFMPYFATPALFHSIHTAGGLGKTSRTWEELQGTLKTAIQTGFILMNVDAQAATAVLLAAESQAERAVELYALASHHPYVANSRWFEDVVGKQIAAVAATLPPEVVAAAQERGRARDLRETAEELLEELCTERL